jgi:hypothetical protein
MAASHRPPPLRFAEPATYRITVEGRLEPRWSERLGGMQISATERGESGAFTILEGEVKDQAALLGVLNALCNLHLPLVSVESCSRASGGESVTAE